MIARLRVAVVLAAALAAAACSRGSDARTGPTAVDGLRVASADFTESELLAEMYAQVIESTGVPVVRLGPVGPREIIAPALELGLIDIVPEYLGTARQYFGATDTDPETDSARSDLNVRLAPRGLTALEPSPAQDKNVFVVTTETADQFEIETISDLADVAGGQRFGGTPECPDRPLCLAGLETVYGLRFAEFVPQRSLVFTAEALHRGEIHVGLMFSTASQLEDPDLVVLEDDRGLQPAENVVPVVRVDALDRWGPAVVEALDVMSKRLTTIDLRILNLRVADGGSIEEVAGEWLAQNVLLGSG